MTQGPRRGWVRAAFTGLGVVLCAGLVGCMNGDKEKGFPPRIGANSKQTPMITNTSTPRIPGQPGSGGVGLGPTGQPGQPNANTFQPTSFGSNTGRMGGTPNSGLSNTGVNTGGGGAPAGVVPSASPGSFGPASSNSFGTGSVQPISAHTGGNIGSNFPTNPPAVTLTNPGLDPIPPSPRSENGLGGFEPIQPPVPATGTFGKGG
jgi:hypothetical protein